MLKEVLLPQKYNIIKNINNECNQDQPMHCVTYAFGNKTESYLFFHKCGYILDISDLSLNNKGGCLVKTHQCQQKNNPPNLVHTVSES